MKSNLRRAPYVSFAHRTAKRALGFETLEPRQMLAGDILISEFMASNSSTLADGNGDFEDWIEVYNAGTVSVDLAGWHLTDDELNPAKWTFPAVSQSLLEPGEYLVVFASGQTIDNYIDSAGNLHTNFATSADGEYLAITDTLGAIIHEYAPSFPVQRTDVSYGINENVNELTLIGPDTTTTVLLPTDGALDAPDELTPPSWTLPTFNDAGWIATSGPAIGYDNGTPPPNIPNGTLLPDGLIGGDFTDPEEDGTANGTIFAGGFPGSPVNEEPDKGLDNLTNTKWLAFEPSGTFYQFRFSGGQRHVVGAYTLTSANDVPSRDPYSWTLSGSNDGANFTVIDTRTAQNFASRFETRLYEFTNSTAYEYYRFDLQTEFGVTGQNQPVAIQVAEFELLPPTIVNFTPLLDLDVGPLWATNPTSLYQRIEFDVQDPSALSNLLLEMQYDDGFAAYLNGKLVASSAAPDLPNFNSHATELREESAVLQPQAFNLTPHLGELQTGTNVLAIHTLNFSDTSTDMLSIPKLTARELIDTTIASVYMNMPTPGGPNTAGVSGLVADPVLSAEHGFYDAPFQLSITNNTPGATLFYTTDGTVPTEDNGTLYDGTALSIAGTTTLRVRGYLDDHLPSSTVTSSYFFVNDIVSQNFFSTLEKGFPSSWGPYSADYGMDPDVIGVFDADGNPLGGDNYGGLYANTIKDDLQAIPTMSLVVDVDDLFGPSGIYTNATASGSAWERPVSVEYFDPDTGEQFHIDAGVRMHGGAFRNNALSRKHSMRLVFKGIYEGNTKLDFPFFGDDAATSFDTIVLRMESNDGYAWDAAGSRAQYARNTFGNESQLAMGHPSSHHSRVHLYINGIYWGLFTPVERPDDSYSAFYFGGDKDNWDAINTGTINSGTLDAWNALVSLSSAVSSASTESARTSAYMRVLGKNPDGTDNPAFETYLDATNYIDYLLLNFYVGNVDWPQRNWWASRERGPESTGFKFTMWDSETALGLTTGVTVNQTGVSSDVAVPYSRLRASEEFRLAFADRVQQALFNDGPLTTEASIARYQAIVAEIDQAIVAESARWGDLHRSTPYVKSEWLSETNRVIQFLQARNSIVISQLKSAGLYPTLNAPSFNQHGGQIIPGFDLTMSAAFGSIYYTTDGSDPRVMGGGISPTAMLYTGSPLEIDNLVTVRARARNGGIWSALNEATFTSAALADATNLRIVEVHYNPAAQSGLVDEQELEFIELLNPSAQPVSLYGAQLAGFAPTSTELPSELVLNPGQRLVVANNPATLLSLYGDVFDVEPIAFAAGNLSNGGEQIMLLGSLGEVIQDFVYDDAPPWPAGADGGGSSLELIDPFADPTIATSWQASYYRGGSPGTAGAAPVIPGDFDGDLDVDGADFLTWQRGYGTSQLHAFATDGDADGDRDVDAADLAVWSDAFGNTSVAIAKATADTAGELALSMQVAAALTFKDEQSKLLVEPEFADIILADLDFADIQSEWLPVSKKTPDDETEMTFESDEQSTDSLLWLTEELVDPTLL